MCIDESEAWLSRAKSNLERAKHGRFSEDIYYEDLCYDCQQAAEKSIKAMLIFLKEDFPWTHSIAKLLATLEKHHTIESELKKADLLTRYATKIRYPGEYDSITEDDYKEALELAEHVMHGLKQE